ncbi:MAG: type II restriction endonuclease [Sutterella sp.]|nr:type II restriction endonuclease [Sutterella sp.]
MTGEFDDNDSDGMRAAEAAVSGQLSFCKFLTANDTGETGGHQRGIHIPKSAYQILFDNPGQKGSNICREVIIQWSDDLVTHSRFYYYGSRTRNEYRITNFGKGFPYLKPEFTGALFVLVKHSPNEYEAYVLNTDASIETFMRVFGLSPAQTNVLLNTAADFTSSPVMYSMLSLPNSSAFNIGPAWIEQVEFNSFISKLQGAFPTTSEMAHEARFVLDKMGVGAAAVQTKPDQTLIDWTNEEYKLFKAVENALCLPLISKGFPSVDALVSTSNKITNRRKSRAGKSFEHHLGALFTAHQLQFEAQAITEGKKRPDFLFPSQLAYHDMSFDVTKLVTLAAKTTCKDRWRQILNEADRLRNEPKFLCTLQQGISSNQIDEMTQENVILVVPKPYISSYPKPKQSLIWSVGQFIAHIKKLQA